MASVAAAPNPAQQQPSRRPAAGNQPDIGYVHPRKQGSKVHFCSSCAFPIAVYGRLLPCFHTFCLSCATDMVTCYICGSGIARIERVNQSSGMHISAATLQGFRTAADLAQHARKLQVALAKLPQLEGATLSPAPSAKRHQQHQPAANAGGTAAAAAAGGGGGGGRQPAAARQLLQQQRSGGAAAAAGAGVSPG